MEVCPQNHRRTGKICHECGYLFPLHVGESIGAMTIAEMRHRDRKHRLYRASFQGRDFALWELFEIYQPDYREQMMAELARLELPQMPAVLNFSVDDSWPEGNLLYLAQDWQPYAEAVSLEQMLRHQELPDGQRSWQLINSLLEALDTLERAGIAFNCFNSSLIFAGPEQCLLTLPAYADRLADGKAHSPVVFAGFSPPEQQRTGRLYAETDRFGLAMVAFHLLTGLTPALWHPDVPRLKRYQYLWGKPVVDFYEALLQPVSKIPASELLSRWQALRQQVSARNFGGGIAAAELGRFYQGQQAYSRGQYGHALDLLMSISQPQHHNPHIPRFIGRSLWEIGRKREAMKWYGEAVRREQLGCFYLETGEFYAREQAWEKSNNAYETAIGLVPYVDTPFRGIGRNAMAAKNYKAAQAWFEQANLIHPSVEATEAIKTISRQQFGAQAPGPSLDKATASLSYRRSEEVPWDTEPPSAGTDLEAGQTIGGFRVEQVIGRRNLATRHRSSTYLVRPLDQPKSEPLFMKETLLSFSGQKRFATEARILKLLSHPCFPRLQAHFESGACAYLLTSRFSGSPLGEYLRDEDPLPEAFVRDIFAQAIDAICELQTHSLVHADIKPQNLIWDAEQRRLGIVDFDIANWYRPEKKRNRSSGFSVDFAPPEQRRSSDINLTTDVFALALSCLSLLTGFNPELFFRANQQRYVDWRNFASVSDEFAGLLDKLLTCDLAQRRILYANAQQAKTLFEALASTPLPRAEALYKLERTIRAFKVSEDPSERDALAKEVLSQRRDARTCFLIGARYLKLGEEERAVALLEESIARDPYWQESYYRLARYMGKLGRYEQAIRMLKKVIDLGPDQAYAYELMGLCYLYREDFKQAMFYYRRAHELEPSNVEYCLELAYLYLLMNALEPARQMCLKALEGNLLSSRAYQLLQMIAAEQGDAPKAMLYGKRALSLRPNSFTLRYDYALSCYRNDNFPEAIRQFRTCLSQRPEHPQCHYFLGSAQLKMGQLADARKHLQIALAAGKQTETIQQKLKLIDQLMSQQSG